MLPSLQMLQQLEQVEPQRDFLLKRELETLSEARQILCRLQLDAATTFCRPATDKLSNAMRSLAKRQDEIFNQLTQD